MDKLEFIEKLIALADELDKQGLTESADKMDNIIKMAAEKDSEEPHRMTIPEAVLETIKMLENSDNPEDKRLAKTLKEEVERRKKLN